MHIILYNFWRPFNLGKFVFSWLPFTSKFRIFSHFKEKIPIWFLRPALFILTPLIRDLQSMSHDSAKDRDQYQKYFTASPNLIHDKTWQNVVSSSGFNIFLFAPIEPVCSVMSPLTVTTRPRPPPTLSTLFFSLSEFMFNFDISFEVITSNYVCRGGVYCVSRSLSNRIN